MAKTNSINDSKPIRPAISPEARENQLISLAVDLVEERLRNGTASSQETTHFLKLGSSKNKLEMDRLAAENKLLKAKAEALETQKELKVLYNNALKAMKNYSGQGDSDEY